MNMFQLSYGLWEYLKMSVWVLNDLCEYKINLQDENKNTIFHWVPFY